MGPQPDVLPLKKIYEAERLAERMIREAEGEAAALLREAGAQAAEIVAERRRQLSERHARETAEAIASIDGEARELRARLQAETERRYRRRREAMDDIVDRLLAMVIPP